ncbi:hypothetical protein CC80DRAFT_543548 [Byssothecium circinans]|uniref:AMP-dependent synthetase/ligase domain-containing protein n=1 Tax=Byssothecium circinans TaxID=147558 RepID=A0A6A5UB62_9PLEO|nr:hypothetical protein CC80DRAFT_543548 [Byssothecium circinans]
MISIIGAGAIVATCPWQATVPELLSSIETVQPKAIVCSEKSLPNALVAKEQAKHPLEIIVQDTASWRVRNHTTGHSYTSNHEYVWEDASSDFSKDQASVLVFSSGTTGSPKGSCYFV